MPLGQQPQQATAVGHDGRELCFWQWASPDHPVGQILLVHGLGEHARRYDALADVLTDVGWRVSAYDQIGHGQSPGRRGDLPHAQALTQDLAAVYAGWFNPALPAVVLGHSMGGLVVADWVSGADAPPPQQKPRGVVLSSPALGTNANVIQRLMLATLPKWFPHLTVANGLNPKSISHDAEIVERYQSDPWVHNQISAVLGAWITTQGRVVQSRARNWQTPTLVQYAGDDGLVSPSATRAFAAAAPEGLLSAHCYDGAYHEIYNERPPWRDAAIQRLLQTLGEWCLGAKA